MVKMLLRDVSMTDLAEMYRRNSDQSPAPYLADPKAVVKAKRLAKKNGVWKDLSENLDPTQDIPVMKRSAFRNYRRVGDREVPQAVAGYRRRELGRAAMALWLKHPKADVDYLQDLLWAYCDDHTWVMAAHEGRAIDLGSAGLGATFAENSKSILPAPVVAWTTTNSQVANLVEDTPGLVKAGIPGTATITATYSDDYGGASASYVVTVE